MHEILDKLKRYGPVLALVPFLVALTVTLPKFYLELKGADVFGTREILKADVVHKYRTEAFLWEPEKCTLVIRIGDKFPKQSLPCEKWDDYQKGQEIDRVDAWTVFIGLDEAAGHAVFDFVIGLIEFSVIILLLRIRTFIEWIERQVQLSPLPKKDQQ